MQIQANLLDTKVVRPKTTETTALGIAFLAGLACGFWESKEAIRDLWVLDKEFHPQQSEKNVKMLLLWRKRMAHTLNNGS